VVIPIFRRGIVAIQAALLSSCVSTHPVGSLRSTGITPLRHYYGPRRLPVGAGPRLCIPAIRCGGHARPAGSLQFPSNRSARAAPNHPGESDGCVSYSFTAGAGFTISGRLATPTLCNEAVSDSLALRLARSLSQSFASRVAPTHVRSATCVCRSFTWQAPFILRDSMDLAGRSGDTEAVLRWTEPSPSECSFLGKRDLAAASLRLDYVRRPAGLRVSVPPW